MVYFGRLRSILMHLKMEKDMFELRFEGIYSKSKFIKKQISLSNLLVVKVKKRKRKKGEH